MFGMLQVLPNTALWHRLEKKGVCGVGNINQTTLMNFIPPTPRRHCQEYINVWELYDAERFLDRTYRCFLMLGAPKQNPFKMPNGFTSAADCHWRQGFKRSTRWKFCTTFQHSQAQSSCLEHYITVCAHNEHLSIVILCVTRFQAN